MNGNGMQFVPLEHVLFDCYCPLISLAGIGLYGFLKRYVNHKTGDAYPTMKQIMDATNLSEPTVRMLTKKLEKYKLIKVIREPGKRSRYFIKEPVVKQALLDTLKAGGYLRSAESAKKYLGVCQGTKEFLGVYQRIFGGVPKNFWGSIFKYIDLNRIKKYMIIGSYKFATGSEQEKGIPPNSHSDLTIVTGAILEKWGKQLVQIPPPAQVMTALQELGKTKMLEAIYRAPLVLKDPDPMKIVGFVIKVAEHPTWYRNDEEVKEKVKNTYDPGELDYNKGRNVIRTYRLMPDDIACKRGMTGLQGYYEKYKDYGERVGMELVEYMQIIARFEEEGVL